MKELSRAIGLVIGRLRVQRGMTQEALSGLAGIARSHLAMVEGGTKAATVDTLWRIAGGLRMPLSELIRLAEAELRQEEW